LYDKSNTRNDDSTQNKEIDNDSDKENNQSNTHMIFDGCSIILIAKDHVKLRLAIENGEKLNKITASTNHGEICSMLNYEEASVPQYVESAHPIVKDDFFLA
jgi:hypothetical protein